MYVVISLPYLKFLFFFIDLEVSVLSLIQKHQWWMTLCQIDHIKLMAEKLKQNGLYLVM